MLKFWASENRGYTCRSTMIPLVPFFYGQLYSSLSCTFSNRSLCMTCKKNWSFPSSSNKAFLFSSFLNIDEYAGVIAVNGRDVFFSLSCFFNHPTWVLDHRIVNYSSLSMSFDRFNFRFRKGWSRNKTAFDISYELLKHSRLIKPCAKTFIQSPASYSLISKFPYNFLDRAEGSPCRFQGRDLQ